jgi:hypothetical protein
MNVHSVDICRRSFVVLLSTAYLHTILHLIRNPFFFSRLMSEYTNWRGLVQTLLSLEQT